MNRTFLRPWFLTFFKSVFKYFLIACFLSFELVTLYIDYSEIPNSELQGIQLISLRYYQYLELSFLVLNAPIYANNSPAYFFGDQSETLTSSGPVLLALLYGTYALNLDHSVNLWAKVR